MIKVLFVCWGNICRSPMAEFVFKDMVKKEGLESMFHIESRATHTDEIWNGRGNPVYAPAREKLAEHGISCKGKTAQLLTKADYNPMDMANFMRRMQSCGVLEFLSDHPDCQKRACRIEKKVVHSKMNSQFILSDDTWKKMKKEVE